MARKKGGARRRQSNFAAIPVNQSLALSTLANGVVIKQTMVTLTHPARMISADLSWFINDLASGEDPIMVGVAAGDYTVAEIAEAINAAPTSPSDRIEKEQAQRFVRKVGFIGDGALGTPSRLNNGKPIRTKMRWLVGDDQEPVIWAMNRTGAILSTGAILVVMGTLYLKWV